jgi:hypothetical protein
MRMIEKEGVKYNPYKMKFMGIEIVRSSTPSFCRKKIEEVVIEIIDKMDKASIRKKLKLIKEEFYKAKISTIAFPRGINALAKYTNKKGNPLPKCPIQLRAAVNYNRLIKSMKLETKYNYIRNGDKIKFIYIHPSPKLRNENIMAFIDELPVEFKLENDIDYETQFEKSFMSPIQKISNAIKWGQIDLGQESLKGLFN